MSIKKDITDKKAKIKLLCKRYAETPTSNPDADLMLGIIEVHKAELSTLLEQQKQYKLAKLAYKQLEGRVTCI